MFFKGVIKDEGIDITIKNNPDHVLAPSDWDKVMKVKFGKMPADEYKTWYLNLLRDRWDTRKDEFLELARQGVRQDIKLKCYCPKDTAFCHAKLAADFLNALVKKLQPK